MKRENFDQTLTTLTTPIMRQEAAFTSVLAQLHDFDVPELALSKVGRLRIGESLSGETKKGTWQLFRDGEAKYRVITKDKKSIWKKVNQVLKN